MNCKKTVIGLALTAATLLTTAAPPPVAAAERPAPLLFKGKAFDTCQAPSLAAMSAWRASPYGAVGVYFGGRGRHCKTQTHLSRAWTTSVRDMGWGVLPLYVGSQSPCVIAKNKKGVRIGRNPAAQGRAEGRDAVRGAEKYGFRKGSPLYLDMEAYDQKNAKCLAKTLSFVRAWNREVRGQGYVTGFYSSAGSGIAHMERARRAGVRDLPEVVWFARWTGKPNLYREPVFQVGAWYPYRRIHQYKGDVKERHGGYTLAIDRNLMHAPVARIA